MDVRGGLAGAGCEAEVSERVADAVRNGSGHWIGATGQELPITRAAVRSWGSNKLGVAGIRRGEFFSASGSGTGVMSN